MRGLSRRRLGLARRPPRVDLLDLLADEDLGDLDGELARRAEDRLELALRVLVGHRREARDRDDGRVAVLPLLPSGPSCRRSLSRTMGPRMRVSSGSSQALLPRRRRTPATRLRAALDDSTETSPSGPRVAARDDGDADLVAVHRAADGLRRDEDVRRLARDEARCRAALPRGSPRADSPRARAWLPWTARSDGRADARARPRRPCRRGSGRARRNCPSSDVEVARDFARVARAVLGASKRRMRLFWGRRR